MNNMKGKIALVTGAGGFIGANLTRRLIKEKFTVHIFVRNKHSIKRLSDIKNKLSIHFTDMSNQKKLTTLIEKISPNYIFHLATFENYRDETKIDEMIQNNILSTKNLLIASLNTPYTCFVNTGSSSEYGSKKVPMKEDHLLAPLSIYAVTKATSTLLSKTLSEQYNKPIITYRLFSVYGPYESENRFIPTVIKSFIKDVPIKLTSGKVNRDFIYIDDVVEAYMQVTKIKIKNGEIFNIGSGKQYSNQEIVKTLEKITNKKIKIEKNSFEKRLWDTPYWVADIKKSKKSLKWSAKTTLTQGLTKTLKWNADFNHYTK